MIAPTWYKKSSFIIWICGIWMFDFKVWLYSCIRYTEPSRHPVQMPGEMHPGGFPSQ